MGVSVTGVEELLIMLKQGGERAKRGAFQAMENEAKEIRDLARLMAPVDEGDLEQAIEIETIGGGRDEFGRFTRKQVVVGIDGEKSAGVNNTVGRYAYEIHEHQAPFGVKYGLGPKSRAKQAGNPSIVVGGKFLERAVAERQPELLRRMIEAVRAELYGWDE